MRALFTNSGEWANFDSLFRVIRPTLTTASAYIVVVLFELLYPKMGNLLYLSIEEKFDSFALNSTPYCHSSSILRWDKKDKLGNLFFLDKEIVCLLYSDTF